MRHQSTFENYKHYPKQTFLKSELLQSITKKHVAYRKFYKLRGEYETNTLTQNIIKHDSKPK